MQKFNKIILTLCLFLSFSILFLNNIQYKYDIALINGTVINGDGTSAVKTDVGIIGDLITCIGDISENEAEKVINCEGLYICPGFIDIHNHADSRILRYPKAPNFLLQGITTVVSGNCGGAEYPLSELFESIENQGVALNFCSYAGHNTIRGMVMGTKTGIPTAYELKKMKEMIENEMKAGAMGLSTGLAYTPGRYSRTDELIELMKVVAKYGGLYATHMRTEGPGIQMAVEEAVRIGKEAGVRVQISHIKLMTEGAWGNTQWITGPVEAAQKDGLEITTDQYPYIASGAGLSAVFRPLLLNHGLSSLTGVNKGDEKYNRIKQFMVYWVRSFLSSLKEIQIGRYYFNPEYNGKNLEEILKLEGKEITYENTAELLMEIEKNGSAECVIFAMNENDVRTLMKLPYNMIGSDGLIRDYGRGVTHPRDYGAFPRIICRYVKELKLLTLEEAVRKMTSLPAQTLKLENRGEIKNGMYADIVIFDYNTIEDKATFQNPHQYPAGIKYVIVNGKIAAKDGEITDNLAGKVLYGPGKQ